MNTSDKQNDLNAPDPQYDRGIVPAEVAARREREGKHFGEIHGEVNDESGDKVSPDSIDVTAGQTIDQEGLANNYAVEPEMYINEPGDLRAEQEQGDADRAHELEDVRHDDETGKLTEDHDERGRGPGAV
jgi:hypothetical protein